MATPLVKAIIRVVMTVASVAYQAVQQKKMKKAQAAAADARKGFEFTVSGESAPLPVVYGKQMIGGVATSRKVATGFSETSSTEDTLFATGLGTDVITGTKSEFLHVQYALCQGGIEGVQGMLVNGLTYDDAEAGFKHRIRIYNDTIVTSPATHEAMGFPATNLFTGAASSTATYRLNRNDYNYNGEPQVQFLMKGRKVRAVELNAGVYSLSETYVYSNNPVLVLIDYLTNVAFGRGLPVAKLDLESFYNAAAACDTVVSSGRSIGGLVNGGDGTRDLPLYECNITLDTEATIRENIERILETMGFAEMMWSPEGKYKLTLDYPTTLAATNALIPSTHVFTDDNILRDDVSLSWLSASERSNQATVNFMNEHEDFKEDSMTWPVFGSTVYNDYLAEDNQQPLRKNLQVAGITDPYHALARAEQEVRKSRQLFTIEFTADKQALSVEIGDLIKLTLSTSGLTDEIFKVNAMEVRADMSVKISAYSFSHEMLAWNVNDDIAYASRPVYDFVIEPVTSLAYTAGRPSGDQTALAELTWTLPIDGSVKSVVYYTGAGGDLVILGETSDNRFFIYPRSDWTDGESVTFTVKAQTPLGRMSTGVSVTNAVAKTPAAPTSFSAVETLYQTNKASGVKARATLSFSEPVGGVEPLNYRVEYYRDEDGSTYELLGNTVGQTFVFNDIRAGNYHFKITPISWFDDEGTPLIGTKLILGLSAIPADPTGFVSKVTDSGILFTWDTPSDLDVVSGGTTEIRYVRNDVITPKWEIAQTIVNNIGGSTTTATLPIAAGYYMIKHIDSSGNACAEPAQLLNSFVGPDFNAITVVSEDPTFAGTKVGCSINGDAMDFDDVYGTSYTKDYTTFPQTGLTSPSGLLDNVWIIDTTFTAASVGCIVEFGGAADGIYVGMLSGGNLRVSVSGAVSGVTNETSTTTTDVSAYAGVAGQFILTIDHLNKMEVWWSDATNGLTLVLSVPFNGNGDWCGSNVGGVGIGDDQAHGGNALTAYTGTLTRFREIVTYVEITDTLVDSNLTLDALATTMTYGFDNNIDLGSVENIRFVPNLTAVITDGTTVVADYDPVSAITRFGGPIVDAAINFEVRTTSDDPAGTPTWSDWETFSVGNYRARGFEFRLTGVVAAAAYTVEISGLSITADKADVYKRGTSTSSAGADTTVTFATGFYGGIGGTDLPYVGCNTVGGSSSDIVNITSITKDTFVYSVYNSGARVARAIAWQAVGQ